MRRKWALIGVMAAFAAAAFAIAAEKGDAEAAPKKADKVLELIEQGRQAYLKEDNHGARTALSKALEELQDREPESLEALFPQPPQGWTGTEIRRVSHMEQKWRIVHLSRTYRRTADGVEVYAFLSNTRAYADPTQRFGVGLQTYPDVMTAPFLPYSKRLEEKEGWTIIATPGHERHLTALALSTNSLTLQIWSRGGDKKLLREFLDMFDLTGLAAAVGAAHVSAPPSGETGKDVP